MSKHFFYTKPGLVILAAVTVIAIAASNLLWNGARIDLTENKLYTLSPGSKNIVTAIEQPVSLKFYFSTDQTEDSPGLRTYARRVQELLEEYAQIGGSKIDLQTIDPKPFSEEEDAADAYGLQSIRLSAGGDSLLFGLVGEREGGAPEVISFFHPDREAFLEQDISKLIFSASRGRKPTLGILSSLDVNGGVNFATRQPTPPWTAIAQLNNLYDVRTLNASDKVIADDIDLLLLIQPGTLTEAMLYAVDQYIMRGGNAMIFADPINDLAQMQRGPSPRVEETASIERLLTNWGVNLNRDTILGDAQHSLTIGRGNNNSPIRHLAIAAYGQSNFPQRDVITDNLETLHFASSGTLESIVDSDTMFTPLVVSSTQSMPLARDKFEPVPDPEKMYDGFKPTGERYVVAARVSGTFKTAFPNGYTPPEPEETEEGASAETSETVEQQTEAEVVEHIASANQPGNLIVVADSDILSDRLWVQVQQFFGQQIAQPFADNGDFMLNAVDNLLGNADLISIRSRGQYSRPFEVVEEMRRDADARFQDKERELLARLDETEAKLAELEQTKTGDESILQLSDEQVNALQQFQEEKLKIRKELREVRHQLGSDIDKLGSWLKFTNIALVPFLITLCVLIVRMTKGKKRLTQYEP